MRPAASCADDFIVVDPNFQDYESLVAELRSQQRRIVLYSTGEEALRSTSADRTTLWVINTRLPDMHGVTLLRLVRRRSRQAAVVLIGDDYLHDDEVAARAVGATLYLCKPPSTDWLLACQPRCRSPAARASPQTA
jgi:DNA-binding response OmpR family regulator